MTGATPMPNATVRANARTMPRRLFLAAGPAAAVFLALRGAKASAKSALDAMLIEYRKADAAYEAACDQESAAEEAMEPVEPPRWTIADVGSRYHVQTEDGKYRTYCRVTEEN